MLTRTEELEHQILSIAIGPTAAAVNRRLPKDIPPFTDEEFEDEQARQTAAEYWERQVPKVKQTEFRRRVVETPQGALRRTEKGSQRFSALAAQKELIDEFSGVKQ